MATYTVNLTPSLRNMATEGSMDTAILDGVSIQRTVFLDVYNSDNKKVVAADDGTSFTDTIETIASLSYLTVS